MDYAKAGRADALAAQYVAGTLRGPARSRFEALLPGHPALQRAVNEWQDRLMPLTTALPETPPPARVWRDIEARLFAGPNPLPSPQPWWQRVAAWRVFSGLALAAVVGLLVSAGRPTPAPVLVVLQSTGAAANASGVILASLSGDGGALVTRPLTKVGLTTDRVLELWSVPPKGAPRPLGLIAADGTTVLQRDQLPASLLKGGTAALAVSVEPPGGSPTGAPTGPVVFAGKLEI